MTTIAPLRHRFVLLAAATAVLLSSLPAQATPGRPVAFYDGDVVLARAAAIAGADARLVQLVERHAAESTTLRRDVDALRAELAESAERPFAVQRELEARLAQQTVALVVAETEAAEEIERERRRVVERLEGNVAALVARIAREHELPVVVRTDRYTRLLDEDAVDLTDEVLAALDGAAPHAPDEELPPLRLHSRTRLQSCAAGTPGAPRDAC